MMRTGQHFLYRSLGKITGIFVAAFASVTLSQDYNPGEETCDPGPGTQPLLFKGYSSFDEGSAAGYRKIRMDGKPFRDATPLSKGLSDAADESTYVDAFSQTLIHQVTDIYIPFEGTEIALAIRRSATPETWSVPGSIHPDVRPDRPFGACWRSGFGASVELVEPIISGENGGNPAPSQFRPPYAYVTDEDGASYRFLAVPYAPDGPIYIYMPFDGNDKRAGEASLGLVNGAYVLSKKHGTVVKFSGSQSIVAIGADLRPIAKHTYSRITEVVLGNGEIMTYTANSVTFRGKTIAVVGGDKVTSVTDPEGNTTTFSYGSENEATVLTSVTKPDGAVTSYGYTGSSEADQTPREPGDLVPTTYFKTLQINSISDPKGNTYSIQYEPDHTKNNVIMTQNYSGPYMCVGSPQLITAVGLPGGGGASFQRIGTMTLGSVNGSLKIKGIHNLAVGDASGASWGYQFGGVKVTRLSDWGPYTVEGFLDPRNIPFYVSFGTMQMSSAAGGISAYFDEFGYLQSYHDINYNGAFQFDHSSAGDVTSQMNPETHQTTFSYGENHKIRTIRDAEGRLTDRTLGAHGRTEKETIKDAAGTTVSVTDYFYGNPNMPTVPTKKIVRKGASDPAWAVDLVTEYQLDAVGNIVMEKVGAPGNLRISSATFDANNNKTSSTDANGNSTGFLYDECNRLTVVDPPGPGAKHLYYDACGNKVREIDERGNVTLWEYDARNRPVKEVRDMNANGIIDEPDLVTTTTYNAVGSKTSVTTPNGQTTQFEYDGIQRLVKTIDPLAGETTFEYGANSGGIQFGDGFKPTRVVNARGFETLTTYNASSDPTEVKSQYATDGGAQPVYSITKLEYDKVGNVLKETDPLNRETTHQYDAHNRKVSTLWPDGTTVQAFYTFSGLSWKSVDELGKDTLTEFDDAGRPVKVSSPEVDNGFGTNARAVTQTEYDDAGNVIETINPLGRSWTFEYDNRNRKVKEIRPGTGAPTFEWVYDAVGNVTKVIDARGAETETIYDAANRATEIKQPLVAVYGSGTSRPTTFSEFDKNGNVVKLTDPNGHETNNTYDELNRLVATEDAEGIIVENEYDEVGNKTAVIDGEEQRTEFEYDGLNRNTKITDAANKSTTFEFDAVNKTARVDGKGQRTEYGYDNRNRLTTVSYTGRSQDNREYEYDATGNLLAVTEPHASKAGKADVSYSYDALRRVLTEESTNATHTYKYDLAGNRINCLYGGFTNPLVSAYDEQNRLTTLTDGTRVTTYTYDLNGNVLTKSLPNGNVVTTTYDALNRKLTHVGNKANTNLIYSYLYQYDKAGNVKATNETFAVPAANRTIVLTYDDINRLTQEAITGNGASTTSYTYDDAHNRATMAVSGASTSYSYNSKNQLTSAVTGTSTISFTYDDNGNRLTRTKGATTDTFGWDYENRLVSLIKQSTGGTGTYSWMYDYRTRRVSFTKDATTTDITFSGGVSVGETENGTPSVGYVRGSDWGGGVGGILYTLRSGAIRYNHYNTRGDVVVQMDASQNTTYAAQYKAFGDRSETGSSPDRQRSNTKDEDMPGYANEGFRFRDIETGAFISRDPAGFIDGPNLYAYVMQNPWTKFDPRGLTPEEAQQIAATVDQQFNSMGFVGSVGRAIGLDKALKSSLSNANENMNANAAAGQGRTLTAGQTIGGVAEGSTPAITAAVLAPAAAAGPLMLAKEGVAEVTGIPIGFDDAAKLLKNADSIVKSAKETVEETQKLFRAVGPDELADIKKTDAFRNPDGIENKYFSTTEAGANQYGEMAEKAFGDPPYTTVGTSIPKKDITPGMKAQVDSGIDTVVVPTNKLNKLEKPEVKEKK